ncbi:hypothetical protein A2U01_0083049, partial [Trifolium medium]|nr:hypothetical protein [Trifolium medium]
AGCQKLGGMGEIGWTCSHDVGERRDGTIEDRTDSASLNGTASFNGKSGHAGTLGMASGFAKRVLTETGLVGLCLGWRDFAMREARQG